jgi:hypothetical protein
MRFAVSPAGLLLVGLLLPAGALGADKVLYATAASEGRIDRFAIDRAGNVAANPNPSPTVTLANPRRILVVGCFLYVAEEDRVEAFRIGPRGGLTRWASTGVESGMRPTDLAVWPPQRTAADPATSTARMLYVAETGLFRVTAYPLEPNGLGEPAVASRSGCSCNGPADCNGVPGSCVDKRCTAGTSPTPCAKGETYLFTPSSCAGGSTRYQSLAVQSSRLYVGGSAFDPQIDGFKLNADGNLIDARSDTLAEVCADFTSDTGACSCSGPADCNGAPGSCVSGRCVGGSRACGEHPDCFDSQTCLPDGVCSCDGPDDCDSTDGSCTTGQCRNSTSATRTCDPTKPSADGLAACAAGQRCLLDRRPTPEWCVRRVHGARIAIHEIDPVNHFVYVTDRIFGRIAGFDTPRARPDAPGSGDFPDGGALRDRQAPKDTPCFKGAACTCSTKKQFAPKKFNVTPGNPNMVRTTANEDSYYEVLYSYSPASATGAFIPPTLFATEFQRGRVDAYRLQPTEKRFIAKKPRRVEEDVRSSPVGLVAADNVLYVSGGELDRIRAYRMRNRKGSTVLQFIGETDEQEGSFPNDVAVVVPDACRE